MLCIVSTDRDSMPMIVDDLLELIAVLGKAGDVSDQYEVRPAGCHGGKDLTTPLGRADSQRNLCHRLHRDHAGTVAPVLQLPHLAVKLVPTL
jgi:hypothetical protein